MPKKKTKTKKKNTSDRKASTTKTHGRTTAKSRTKARKTTHHLDSLIVSTKVKAFIKSQDCLTSGDFLAALNQQVYELVKEATVRAHDNRRSTVKTHDL